jgi:hypothetical protein
MKYLTNISKHFDIFPKIAFLEFSNFYISAPRSATYRVSLFAEAPPFHRTLSLRQEHFDPFAAFCVSPPPLVII